MDTLFSFHGNNNRTLYLVQYVLYLTWYIKYLLHKYNTVYTVQVLFWTRSQRTATSESIAQQGGHRTVVVALQASSLGRK
jgi:hypothetical protein